MHVCINMWLGMGPHITCYYHPLVPLVDVHTLQQKGTLGRPRLDGWSRLATGNDKSS